MNDLKNLVRKLNEMEPFSIEFGELITGLLSKHKQKNDYTFLKQGQIARKSWYLLSGFIIASRPDSSGNPIVTNIYGPGTFVTDFLSFFNKEPVTHRFSAVGNVEVIQLKYADYQKLSHFPEAARLTQLIILGALKIAKAKSDRYLLTDEAKMTSFFSNGNISGIPDKYGASFLHIQLENYVKLKLSLLKSGKIKLKGVNATSHNQGHNLQKVYEVKSYLLANYTRPDIDNIVDIATLFNTTKKTLTLNFRKTLNTTVHKLVFKLRMERAHQLFSRHKTPVKEVYKQVGYKNVYHFSKLFKKYHGVSAKEVIAQQER
jgi:AraC-like DNA-binding protein